MRAVTIDYEIPENDAAANDEHFALSKHAQLRMSQRAIGISQVQQVLEHGRMIHSRRARFYVVGKKDAERMATEGLSPQCLENIQVVVEEKTNTIVTVYRNKNFRAIRPVRRHERRMQ